MAGDQQSKQQRAQQPAPTGERYRVTARALHTDLLDAAAAAVHEAEINRWAAAGYRPIGSRAGTTTAVFDVWERVG